MRVTNKMMNDGAVRYMDENLQKLTELQQKVASQKQFQYASENPSGAVYAMNIRSSMETNKAYLETAHNAKSWMAATDFSLSKMVDTAKRAKLLVQQGISDTVGVSERQAFAAELEMVLDQAVDLANATHQGNYLFAGFKTTSGQPPYQVRVNDALPDAANDDGDYNYLNPAPATTTVKESWYNGDNGVITRAIGPHQTIAQNVTPSKEFKDLFETILKARDQLNDSTDPDFQANMATLLGDLDSEITALAEQVTTNGARQRQVQLFGEHLDKTQIELKSLLSKKEDVNMAEAITALRYQETVYQSVLEVGHRTISALNLFDMMG